jgi:hypothetical protein
MFKELSDQQFSHGKLVLFGAIAFALYFGSILTVFTPLPLILAGMYFPRWKAYGMGLVWAGFVFIAFELLNKVTPGQNQVEVLVGGYLFFWLVSVLMTEIIHRVNTAGKALFFSGSAILLLAIVCSQIVLTGKQQTLREFTLEKVLEVKEQFEPHRERIMSEGGDSGLEFFNTLNEPEIMTQTILDNIFRVLFVISFVLSWVNLITLPWASSFFSPLGQKTFLRRLIDFRVPENMVWFIIGFLALLVIGTQIENKDLEKIGTLGLTVFGVFYFFHGFGLYYQFVSTLRIGRFLRTLLLMLMVTAAYKFLMILGVLDVWVNFKKYFANKKLKK